MAVAAFLIGFVSLFLGGFKVIIFLISKLMGAQKITANVVEYKKINGNNNRMYLTIDHEKAPQQIWLDEMIQFKNGEPEIAVGAPIEVYWVAGRRTAMRADTLKRNAVSIAIDIVAITAGIILMFAGAAID